MPALPTSGGSVSLVDSVSFVPFDVVVLGFSFFVAVFEGVVLFEVVVRVVGKVGSGLHLGTQS